MLGLAAGGYGLGGDVGRARPLAVEALQLARHLAVPFHVALSLLACALTDPDRRRAQAHLDEAVALQESLDLSGTLIAATTTAAAARLSNWSAVLHVAERAIHQLNWNVDRPWIAGQLIIAARAVAETDPEAAAVILGVARRFAMIAYRSPAAVSQTARSPCGDQRSGPAKLSHRGAGRRPKSFVLHFPTISSAGSASKAKPWMTTKVLTSRSRRSDGPGSRPHRTAAEPATKPGALNH
jgi:hypothetical protein